MFSSTDDKQKSEEPKKPTSIISSLTNFFTGNNGIYNDDDDDDYYKAIPLSKSKQSNAAKIEKTKVHSKKNGDSGTTPKPSSVHNNIIMSKEDDSWFGATSTANVNTSKKPSANIMKTSLDDETWFSNNDGFGSKINRKTGSKTGGINPTGSKSRNIKADIGSDRLFSETKKDKNPEEKSKTKSRGKSLTRKHRSTAAKSAKNSDSFSGSHSESHSRSHSGSHSESQCRSHSESQNESHGDSHNISNDS